MNPRLRNVSKAKELTVSTRMMASGFRVGVIGFGRIGAEHAGWIARSGATVSAVYDPTPARLELARSRGLPTAGSLRELLDRCDAVLVATPTSFHHEHTLTCLAAGKHVMVEKPMALTLDQSLEMVSAARSAGRMLCVFQCRRWDADFLAVRRLVASGRLGRVFNVESRLGQWASCVGPAAREWRPGWRNEAAYGGGGLFDWGSHFVDQLHLLMAPVGSSVKPVRVFAQLRGNVWTRDCDDFARVVVDFSDGASGLVEINTTTTRPLPRWHLDGTLGSAESPYSLEFDTHRWAELAVTLADSSGGHGPQAAPTVGGELGGEGFTALAEWGIWAAFTDACQLTARVGVEEAAKVLPVSPASVLNTMSLLQAAMDSAHSGQAVIPRLA
jgi:predicted dehydrogenase